MSNAPDKLKSIISHCKEYGFVFPSSEIYDGLSAVYDYGQNGVLLKNNIREYWWKAMVQMHDNIVGIDAAIFMHPKTWKASGHIDGFSDPMIDNKDSKKRYRADQLLEDKIEKYLKAQKFDAAQKLKEALETALENDDLAQLKALIEEEQLVCPVSGTRNWTDVRQFNLMYSTKMGSLAEDADEVYLRPETAQGIFVNFLNVQKSARLKVPFGIAQTGKAFRNEIIARQFIMRMREFEQMEMQFFVRPGTENHWYEYWKEQRLLWYKNLGITADKLRIHDHAKLAHYASAALDIEYDFPFGFKEVEGIHSRTDFDLKQHQNMSGKKLQYFDADLNDEGKAYGNYVPYVIETSVGLDRLFLLLLSQYLEEETIETEGKSDTRTVLKLPAFLAPIKLAVFPLVKKDGLPDKAKEIVEQLKFDYHCLYEEKDAIGKRYRRMDALGTPFCITVDYETMENDTVTLRYRDSMEQTRIHSNEIPAILAREINWKNILTT